MRPPYKITPYILAKVASISEKLGEIKAARLHRPPTELRKKNRIRTIHSEDGTFTRKDYLRYFKELSTATASRDLKDAVESRLFQKEGEKSLTCYKYIM